MDAPNPGLVEKVTAAMRPYWTEVEEHPLVRAVGDGSASSEALRIWARQKFCQQREFANNLAIIFSRMPLRDSALRASLAGNIYEERDHSALYLAFARGLGLDEEEMWASQPLPATAAFSDFAYRLAREGSMAEIAAALHVGIEGLTIRHFPTIARGLREHYNLDEDARAFWDVHDEADTEHFTHGIAVLEHYLRDSDQDLDSVLASGRRAIELYAATYTTCWEAGQTMVGARA